MKNIYNNNLEHLYDELLLTDLIIHAQVLKFRKQNKGQDDPLKGLYISEEEIDALLEGNQAGSAWAKDMESAGNDYDQLLAVIDNHKIAINEKVRNSIENNIQLNLVKLAQLYSLTQDEIAVITVCLAPQFDTKYRKLFAYLQNDATRKNPSIELLVNLLYPSFEERLAARDYFSEHSPLFKNMILDYIAAPGDPNRPLIAQEVSVNNRIVDFLLDRHFIDSRLSAIAKTASVDKTLKETLLPEEILGKLSDFIQYCKKINYIGRFIFSLCGPNNSQNSDVASAVCNELGIKLLVVDLLSLYNSDIPFEYGIDLLLRESRLLPAALIFQNSDSIFSGFDEDSYNIKYFINELDKNSWLTFISSIDSLQIHGSFTFQKVIDVELPVPDYYQRKNLWTLWTQGYSLDESVDLKEISGKYNLTGEQIKHVITTAQTYALWRSPENPVIVHEDIIEACHVHSNRRLKKLARRIVPKHSWDDIVLEQGILNNLKEIVNMMNNKHIVYNEWGFEKKLTLGKGICALFYGEPGTGKTFSAEIIAKELNMDLYKIDISTIVSKFIGETEKNLNRIFTEAESSNAILFFDEADSLFGKRTEVKDSHDRYANLEVSYLLQKIDEYRGIVIMATNFNQNIDTAFERRLHFSINFPFPNEESRLQIFQNIFPPDTPLDDSVDFALLAKNLEVSGGSIKNIALSAAFYAAEQGKPVSMDHLLDAGKKEFTKMGRLWNDDYFIK